MIKVVSQNVPICPHCKAMMKKRYSATDTYFICTDCKSIWRVLDNGQSEIELFISDNMEDKIEERAVTECNEG